MPPPLHCPIPSAGVMVAKSRFYVGVGDLNTGPQACVASPLPTESVTSPTSGPLFPSFLPHAISAADCSGRAELTENKSLFGNLSNPRDLGRSFSPVFLLWGFGTDTL